MARRRVNTKFLGGTFVVLLGGAGALYVGQKLLVHHDPKQYVAAGDMYAKQHDWAQAANNYGQAAQLSPRDADVWTKLGNAQMQLRGVDRDQAMAAVQAWRHATEINPDFLPAWTALLSAYMEDLGGQEMTQHANAGVFARTREVASQCVRLDPKNGAVTGLPAELNIRMWLDNIPLPSLPGDDTASDAQRVQDSVAQLQKVAGADTTYPFWIARAKIRQAEDAMHDGQASIATARFDEASKAFDASIVEHPTEPRLYLSQFDVLGQLMSIDGRVEAKSNYEKKRRETLAAAQSKIDSTNPLYPVVKTQYASMITPSDPPKAEGIYRDLIAKFPTNYGLKVSLAGLLGAQPNHADDALNVLGQLPDEPPSNVTGNARVIMEGQLTDARLTRATIRAQKLQLAATPAERERLNGLIDTDLSAVPSKFMNDWHVEQAIGKVQLHQGKVRDAIQSLEKASQLLKQKDPNRSEVSLLLAQADAYRAGGQASQAIVLYQEALASPKAAADPLPHLRLAQLYLSQNDRSAASAQVEWLKKRFPYNPEVVGLEISALDPVKDLDQARQLYSGLPETDDGAKLRKVQIAELIGAMPETARLLNDVYNDHPGDPRLALDLARADLAVGNTDGARQVLRESMKLNPGFTPMKLLQEQLDGVSASQREATLLKSFENIKDPAVRELQLAQYADQTGRPADATAHLEKAYAANPKNVQIATELFSHYMAAHDLKKAEPLLQPLSDMDADQARGLVFRFNYTLGKGDVVGALALGRKLTADFPEFSGSWGCLGQALEASGNIEDASTKYLAALDRQATNYVALRRLIGCYYQLNRISDAQQYIAQGRQRFPADAGLRQLEIEHMLDYGDPQNAVSSMLAGLKAAPENRGEYLAAAQVISRASATMRAKGKADVASEDLKEARDVLKLAVDKWPEDPTFVVPYASSLNATGDFAGGERLIKSFAEKPDWKNKPDLPLALAQYYQASGRTEQAEAPLRDAMKLSNGSPLIRNELVNILASERKFDAAIDELKAEKPSAELARRRVQLLLDANRTADAETVAGQARQDYPKDGSFSNLLALSELRQNKLDAATAVVNAALKKDDQNTGAHYVRGLIDLQPPAPKSDEASRDLQFVLAREPGNAPAAVALADLQARGGELDLACRTLESSLRSAPSSKDIRLRLVDLYARTTPPRWDDATRVIELGKAYGQLKNDPDLLRAGADVWARRNRVDDALDAIRQALKVAPNRPDLVHDYFAILLQAGQNAQVLDESQTLLNNPPVPWWGYADRGIAMAHSGNVPDAAGQFDLSLTAAGAAGDQATLEAAVSTLYKTLGVEKAIELVMPRTASSMRWKLQAVGLLDAARQQQRAIALLDSAMPELTAMSKPEQVQALQLAGNLYLNGRPPALDKAIDIYKKLLALDPTNAIALNNLASLLSEMVTPPQLDQALVYSQRAYDQVRAANRMEPLIYDTQGWILIQDGRLDEGIDVLHHIIDKAPFPEAHYHLAEGYLRKQLPLDAQRELLAADDLIDKASSKNKPIDITLKTKISDAMRQAEKMQNAKTDIR